ncbi:MAG: hypothetical protein KKF67_02950 [Nanoarchaeota archaeon]|nr:hypothetical protein [Nanoarchaeota archaeon]
MSNYYIECKPRKDLQDEIYGSSKTSRIPLWTNVNGVEAFKGFEYFSPVFVNNNYRPARFVLAREGKHPRDIIGVMLLSNGKDESLPPYYASTFSDVRDNRKRQGIITRIYEELNNILTPEDFLVGTPEAGEGERARLHELTRKIVTVCPVFDDQSDFRRYCKENGLLPEKPSKD